MIDAATDAQRPLRVDVRSTIYIAMLSLAAAYFLAWPTWRAQFMIEIWPTESWNAYFQDMAASRLPIYPAPESLIGNNYPPLSFYAMGFIGKLLGVDNLFVGRGLSLVALAAIAAEVFMAVRCLTAGKTGAAIAALWFVAIMARNSTIYIGTDDPQLAGLAIMGAALVYFLQLWKQQKSPIPAVLLMVVAGFWKHNNIAVPLTALTWLYIDRSPYAVRATIIGGGAALSGLLVCAFVFGPNFLPNLLANREYAWAHVVGNISRLQWPALALFIWVVWAVGDPRSKYTNFTALHIGFGLFACILQWFGHGVFGNAEFDFLLALAIGIGVAFNQVGTSWLAPFIGENLCRDVMIGALFLRLVVADRQETALLFLSPDFRNSIYANEQLTASEAKAIAAMPGNVACDTKLVCRLAGKPFVVDEFKMEELIATGKATPREVADMIEANHIKTFAIAPRKVANDSFLQWWRS